ncbi:hypothetical protein JKY79_00235 [Candidatus Babeliales bacterium]|nr:hypothetical protein [Candidatus Babeliales bacterium]
MSQFYSKKHLLSLLIILNGIGYLSAEQVSAPLIALEDDQESSIPVIEVSKVLRRDEKKLSRKNLTLSMKSERLVEQDKNKDVKFEKRGSIKQKNRKQKSSKKVEFLSPDRSKKDINETLDTKDASSNFFDLTSTDQGRKKKSLSLESPLKISQVWKEMMRQDFDEKTSYLSAIIHQGEENEQEKQDFTDRFKKNKEWVHSSLSIIKTVADKQFDSLMQRKDRIDMLVKTQQQADTLIQRMTSTRHIPGDVVRHVRLAVLYALNDLIGSGSSLLSKKKIAALVEEKTIKYGNFRAKGTISEQPITSVNLELSEEVKRLRTVLKDQTEKYESDYEALLRQLKDTERENKVTEGELVKKEQEFVSVEKTLKNAELKSSIAEQARKEATYSANKTVEEGSRKNFELEVSLEQAEREKLEAEKALRRALSDYKEVNELVSLLQNETDGLVDQNRTLTVSLERSEEDKKTLKLEKKHIQRQYDRFKKESLDLNKKILSQKESMDNLRIDLEKISNEKAYAVTQIKSMKKLQESYVETEKALSGRLQRIKKQLESTHEQAKEFEGIVQSLQKEHTATLEHIESLEIIKKDNVSNRKLLKKEIGRVMQEQVEHRVKLEELNSSLEADDISRKRKRQLKKEVESLKEEQEATELDLSALQDMYETTQVQDDTLSSMLKGLKSYVFDQDLELSELQKALKGHRRSVSSNEITTEEEQVIALKRKNRALKNRLASLEAKLQAKQSSKAEEYFSKATPSRKERLQRRETRQKREVKQEEKEISKPEEKNEEKIKDRKEDDDFIEAEKKIDEPSSSIEEIVGKADSENSQEAETVEAINPVEPALPKMLHKREFGAGNQKTSFTASGSLPGKEEMKEVVDAMKQTISENPEDFENFMQNVQPPSEEQVQQAQKEIEAMSSEEREQFEEFMQNFVSSLVDEEK